MDAHSLGKKSEDQAALFLQKLGYRVIERNCRSHLGEIDIIAMDGKELVFVEVKSMTESMDFDPMDHFDHKKEKKLLQLVQHYTSDMVNDIDQRIDIILVYYKNETFTLDHYKDVL